MVAHINELEEWSHHAKPGCSISQLLNPFSRDELLASFLRPASLDSCGAHHDAGYFSLFQIVVLLIIVIHIHSVTIYGSLELCVS